MGAWGCITAHNGGVAVSRIGSAPCHGRAGSETDAVGASSKDVVGCT